MMMLRFLLFGTLLVTSLTQAAPVPDPPTIAGSSHILLDYNSNAVISESNADARVEPASLTKMMTAYVVFGELKAGRIAVTDKVRVSEKAWRMVGSRMFIEVDKEVSVDDLIKGMVIQSGNDASVALAEHVAGSEEAFASLMNQQAARLGLKDSHFMNATGLPHPDHYTTAHDMALLGQALIRDFPEHYPTHAMRKFTYNGIDQHNRNRLLWRDDSVDGIKTGHTESAGYCLVASAQRDGMRLISAVMGTSSEKAREHETQKLLNYGFRFYETRRVYQAGEPVHRLRVWKGASDELDVGLATDLWLTIPRGRYKDLVPAMAIDGDVIAPVKPGQAVARVSIALDGEQVAERPLVALRGVSEGGLWTRLSDQLRLMIKN